MNGPKAEVVVILAVLVIISISLIVGFLRSLRDDSKIPQQRWEMQEDGYAYPRESVRNVSVSPMDPERRGWWPR